MHLINDFAPALLLCNPHLMTVVPRYWPRKRLREPIPQSARLFTTEPGTQLLGLCHWQNTPQSAATIILVHGLEGCANSYYMQGMATKAYEAGFNVIRMNQRTCGDTEHLCPGLYNTGQSNDYRMIIGQLAKQDQLSTIWLVGFSMGGNLVLKAAGELGRSDPALAGVAAVSPNIDPIQCVAALELPRNRFYHWHFLSQLKARVKRKAKFFPGKWDLAPLKAIRSITQFDACYTAPDGGYCNVADYYDRAGAHHVLDGIAVPALIITAQDDPFIPPSMFDIQGISRNKYISLIMPQYGGHCGFFQKCRSEGDPFWAEQQIMTFLGGSLLNSIEDQLAWKGTSR